MLSEEARYVESVVHFRPSESVSPSADEPQEIIWDFESEPWLRTRMVFDENKDNKTRGSKMWDLWIIAGKRNSFEVGFERLVVREEEGLLC